MRKTISTIACGFAVLLTLGLCAVSIRQAYAVCDSCTTSPCSPSNFVGWLSVPGTTQANASENFEVNICFQWGYTEPPTYGDIEFRSDISENMAPDTVAYNPEYMTDVGDCCWGGITVVASGTLDDENFNGTLKTRGSFSIPEYKSSTKTVIVYKF